MSRQQAAASAGRFVTSPREKATRAPVHLRLASLAGLTTEVKETFCPTQAADLQDRCALLAAHCPSFFLEILNSNAAIFLSVLGA